MKKIIITLFFIALIYNAFTQNKSKNVDIVYVASPNSLHYPQCKMALEHKKHVINEKPFTPTLKECNDLFEIAQKNGV